MNPSDIDPRVLRTHRSLQNAVKELVTEKSFASLTIQEVAHRAGVNRTTFYLHYSGLHELLEDTAKEMFAELREEIYAIAPRGAARDIQIYEPCVERVFILLQKNHRFFNSLLGKDGDPYFSNLFRESIGELIFDPIRSELSDEHESDLILSFFTAGFTGIATWWLENKMPLSPAVAAQRVTTDLLPSYIRLVQD